MTEMSELCDLPAAILAASEESSYVIKIGGYSRIKAQIKHGNFVKSTPFSVGGHRWHVRYFPNGCPAQKIEADSISLFLVVDSALAKDVKVKTRFSLLDKDGEPVESHSHTAEHIFRRKGSDWGFRNFITKAVLESSVHLRDDSFSIRCDVTVVQYIHEGKWFVAVPQSDLHRHLGDLLETMDGADVTFLVGGESISAHRSILAARSSVFRAELFGGMKERGSGPIDISDMGSDVFKSLLHFIYTDSLPVPETGNEGETARRDVVMAGHLLVAADRYNIERLKLICEEKLCNAIDADIVATSLALAEQHSFHRIKEACFEFLTSPSNLEAMMSSDGYEHLKNSCPSVLKELAASFLPAELKAVKEIIMTI